MTQSVNIEELNLENVIQDIVAVFINPRYFKVKKCLPDMIRRIVMSTLNDKCNSVYKKISIFPREYPHDLDEFIMVIGKVDGMIFYDVSYNLRSFVKPRAIYKILEKSHRYSEVLKYASYSHWVEKQCEIGYQTATKILKEFKLPEFDKNKHYFFRVNTRKIRKRKNYAIIETLYENNIILSAKDDFIIVNKKTFKSALEKFGKVVNADEFIKCLKKEILLNEM